MLYDLQLDGISDPTRCIIMGLFLIAHARCFYQCCLSTFCFPQKTVLGLILQQVISAQTCLSNVTSILTGLLMLAAVLWDIVDGV